MSKPANPPAFPQHVAPAYRQEPAIHGMSLRDYFAAVAMPIAFDMLHKAWIAKQIKEYDSDTIAKASYGIADAMLAEREKP